MHTRIKLSTTAAKARVAARRENAPPKSINRPQEINDPAARALAEKDRVLGFAAHELRNPLSTICGLAEFLRDGAVGELTPHQRNLVTTIHAASQSALELVNTLLETESAVGLNWERHDVTALVQESVGLMTLAAARKDIHLVFAPALHVEVEVDGPKIKQVVTNLLSNAIKYSPPGSTVTVRLEHDARAGVCRVAVRDQGPGIPADERHKLFTLFGRLSVEPTGGEKATGLGLALCRRIVDAHRGTIETENLPGGGCEFRVELPLRPGVTETPPPSNEHLPAVPVVEEFVSAAPALAAA